MKNVTPRFQNHIHIINIFDSDSIMIRSTAIISVANTLKNIYPGGYLRDEFTSEYYNYGNDTFGLLFQQYITSGFEKISTSIHFY